tara:strand:- start:1973 stop:3070 length:1098 start_codon:yes stop_codon:yes gene_type:complete
MSSYIDSCNSGVETILGFEFQRNCALLVLLEDYDDYKDRNYFISIEHYDDFLFCFTSESSEEINEVRAYQAKKKDSGNWTLNSEMYDIIGKMVTTGIKMRDDDLLKGSDFTQRLTFISNQVMHLKYQLTPNERKEKIKPPSVKLNLESSTYRYIELPLKIQNQIKEKLPDHVKTDLKALCFQWVDLNRSPQNQKNLLSGHIHDKFPNIRDPFAAVELIFSLFKNVETTHNQRKVVRLADQSKRIDGSQIKNAIDVIESTKKTYEHWREYSQELSKKYSLPFKWKREVKIHINNTLERLKDLENFEYQKVRSFVHENDLSNDYEDISEIIDHYLTEINDKYNIHMEEREKLLCVFCAFSELHMCNT